MLNSSNVKVIVYACDCTSGLLSLAQMGVGEFSVLDVCIEISRSKHMGVGETYLA